MCSGDPHNLARPGELQKVQSKAGIEVDLKAVDGVQGLKEPQGSRELHGPWAV